MSIVHDIPLRTPNEWEHSEPLDSHETATVVEQVHRGAEWLDSVIPGWPLLVDQPIDIGSHLLCVAGQVGGMSFDIFLKSHRLPVDQWRRHGFLPRGALIRATEAVWTTLINDRRLELRH